MNKVSEPIFDYNSETGLTTCILFDKLKDKTYIGFAQCHPDDEDMMNEKTGCNIALMRAQIKALQAYKNNELTPALNALKQLYYSMNRSKFFNENSYEVSMLLNQIEMKKEDILITKNAIQSLRIELKTMIDEKDDFYQKVRKNRKANID